jgi:predicted DNA-binding transcriptional regulator
MVIMKIEILKQFGLHNNDIKVYEALYLIGTSKTGAIIKETGISSSRVYESLRLLTEKGLVSYLVKNNVKYYRAELPNQLIDEYKQNLEELNKLSKSIASLPQNKQDRNEINVFEGVHGFQLAFSQHLENVKKNEPLGIIGFGSNAIDKSSLQKISNFFVKVDEWTFPKTGDVRMLLEKKLNPIIDTIHERKDIKKYKLGFLPKNYFGPIAINLSLSEVMLSVWGKKPIVFSIKNKVVVESFWKNFEVLWGSADKK